MSRHSNIILLAPLCAATQQKDQRLTVFAEINSMSRTKIQAHLEYTGPDPFH